MKKTITILSALIFSTLLSARADILSQWTFETSPPADLTDSTTISGIAADFGAGIASGVHAGALSDWTTPVGNGSANSLSVNTWTVGDYFQFQLSTIGFTGIGISFDQTSSGTGPRDFDFAYSTDGSVFTTFSSYSVLPNGVAPNASWNGTISNPAYSFAFDLSGVSAIDEQASVYFRLINSSTVSASGGIVGAAGTDRVDNFTVYSPVPEPSTAALLGLGLLTCRFIRRRN